MPDDTEERRKQDLRDFEFYRQRLRPTASDLWRIIEGPQVGPPVISEPMSQRKMGEPEAVGKPAPFLSKSAESRQRPGERPDADAVWPLVAALIVLVVLGFSGQIDRIPQALLF